MELPGLPPKQGLYDPQHEKDSCGIGFVVNIKGHKSHDIIRQGLKYSKISRTAARRDVIPALVTAREYFAKFLINSCGVQRVMPA